MLEGIDCSELPPPAISEFDSGSDGSAAGVSEVAVASLFPHCNNPESSGGVCVNMKLFTGRTGVW